MQKFMLAVGCLLLACFIGSLMVWDVNSHSGTWKFSVLFFYLFVLIMAAPFWLFIFLPLYFVAPAGSFFWRWYVAPVVGIVLGLGMSYLLSAYSSGIDKEVATEWFLAPVVVGFCAFLFGTLSKKMTADPQSEK